MSKGQKPKPPRFERLAKEWTDLNTGYECRAIRDKLGYWCDYVKTPKGVVLHDDDTTELEVHGGITYAELEKGRMVYGFDCAHSGDLIPGLDQEEWFSSETKIYRDFEFVERECTQLAAQIQNIVTTTTGETQ